MSGKGRHSPELWSQSSVDLQTLSLQMQLEPGGSGRRGRVGQTERRPEGVHCWSGLHTVPGDGCGHEQPGVSGNTLNTQLRSGHRRKIIQKVYK